MPLEGEKLDELLSGFIDAELDDADRELVAQTLESDASARERLGELRQMSQQVREVGNRMVAGAALPADFTARVLAMAERQAQAGGLPETHQKRGPAVDRQRPVEAIKMPAWRKPGMYIGLAAGMAAMWLTAVYLPALLKPKNGLPIATALQSSPTSPNATTQNSTTQNSTSPPNADVNQPLPDSVAYIGQDDFRIRYALIADVQVTRQAVREDIFGSVLAAAGITRAEPITVNPEVEMALAETRMIVQPAATEKTEDSLLFFLRADARMLDAALQAIWSDKQHFPNVRLDLAIDNPKSKLIEKIARSTGRRFATNESFAAPIAASDAVGELPGGASPFPASSANTKYVSRQSRDRGWSGLTPLAPQADPKASMLIVLHIVD